jgi:branched-chain amino acid transport system substrate-binding protein
MLRAAELAVREINESGGVNGRPLELVPADDSAKPAVAIAVAQRLRDDPTIVAVVGHLTSGTTIAAVDIYQAGNNPLPSISPSASNPDLSGFGPWFFRVCATDLAHGAVLARFALERLRARRAAVFYLNDDYGRGILGTFADEFRQREGVITSMDPLLPGLSNLAPYLERLQRDGRAQVIMVAGDRTAGVAVLRQARERGITLPLIGGDGLSGIQDEGAIAEGVYITSNYLPDQSGARNAQFLPAYAAANAGERPDHRGAGAYDAVYLIARAAGAVGSDRRALREELARINGRDRPAFEGVTGRIAFDERGDVVDKNVLVGVVRGGGIVPADGR